ncbi:MAG: hypothetical protein V4690_01055 [Patescibacteria group bacterium]
MNTKNKNNEGGFIMKIVLLIAAIIALKVFLDFDLIAWLQSEAVMQYVRPVIDWLKEAYYWLDEFVRNLVS